MDEIEVLMVVVTSSSSSVDYLTLEPNVALGSKHSRFDSADTLSEDFQIALFKSSWNFTHSEKRLQKAYELKNREIGYILRKT